MDRCRVICEACGHRFSSKVARPRCSACKSYRVVDDKGSADSATPSETEQLQTHELNYAEIFAVFDEGKLPIDLVKLGLCDPKQAIELGDLFQQLKSKEPAFNTRSGTEEGSRAQLLRKTIQE
jgi:hypothetical protein